MTSGRTTTSSRPGAAPQARPDAPPPDGTRRYRPVLAAAVAALLVAGTAAAVAGTGSAEPTSPSPEDPSAVAPASGPPASSDAFAVTPPAGWTAGSAQTPPLTVFGVPFVRLAEAPPFAGDQCPAGAEPRGVAAASLVAVPAGTTVEEAARAFARGAGESAYAGSAPQVAVGPAGPRPVGGAEPGSWVEATVRTDGGRGCRATDGTVGVLAVPRTQAQDGSTGVAMLVVTGDVTGGPGDAIPRADLIELVDSAVPPHG